MKTLSRLCEVFATILFLAFTTTYAVAEKKYGSVALTFFGSSGPLHIGHLSFLSTAYFGQSKTNPGIARYEREKHRWLWSNWLATYTCCQER